MGNCSVCEGKSKAFLHDMHIYISQTITLSMNETHVSELNIVASVVV